MIMKGELMKKLRVYIDTSVVGGCHDEEFQVESRMLMDMARRGSVVLLVSHVLFDELAAAPVKVQSVLTDLPTEALESVAPSEEAEELQRAYLKAKVVQPPHGNDALHVAVSTVAKADMIVSWNFKHIVHFEKIRGFNAVNLREGYLPIEIRSPKEVV
jgi:predicted nucleic acid-binding protein